MSDTLETIEIETGPAPTAAVIWLHGLGADGHDFAPIVPELGLAPDVAIRFVFPHAPTMPVTVNGGYVMRAWYDILGADLTRREDEAGLRRSQRLVDGLIAREIARGCPSERIVLAGFSQGCAMALLTGVRSRVPLAGLIGLSGYLPLLDTTQHERSAVNANIPIFLAHGTADPIVPLARAIATRDTLMQLGYHPDWHTYPMPHSVHPQEIAEIGAFLNRILGCGASTV